VRTEGGQWVNEDTVKTARETLPQVEETPNWTNAPGFEKDVFTYARVMFKSPDRAALMGWLNDYPDGDLNLSLRLHDITTMKVDPDGRVLKLTDPALFNYPLIFASQPGGMLLREEEVVALRKYLLNGGAFLVDDCWGSRNWNTFEAQMKRVFPDRQWIELTMDHPVFHCVYDFKGPMNNLQVPSIHFWRRQNDPNAPQSRVSAIRGPDSEEMHMRAWLDDRKRIMIIATYNTDNGDGYERECEDEDFFHAFSETRSYPLAINVIFYLMTH
jgi:hypothetical protein